LRAASQPITGSVERVEGADVVILTEEREQVTIHVDNNTSIRDMNSRPRIPLSEMGSHRLSRRTRHRDAQRSR
jgi:hypothetical protein